MLQEAGPVVRSVPPRICPLPANRAPSAAVHHRCHDGAVQSESEPEHPELPTEPPVERARRGLSRFALPGRGACGGTRRARRRPSRPTTSTRTVRSSTSSCACSTATATRRARSSAVRSRSGCSSSSSRCCCSSPGLLGFLASTSTAPTLERREHHRAASRARSSSRSRNPTRRAGSRPCSVSSAWRGRADRSRRRSSPRAAWRGSSPCEQRRRPKVMGAIAGLIAGIALVATLVERAARQRHSPSRVFVLRRRDRLLRGRLARRFDAAPPPREHRPERARSPAP